ncbi:MAG: hypothetical protein FJY66_03205 [Calditrichaeota bacterium]|nr:hypothetical protein [Calditrichota bacterium]
MPPEQPEFFFAGEYTAKLDEQPRLSIPIDFRRALKEGGENELVFCQGLDNSTCVFPRKYFQWHSKSKSSSPTTLLENFHINIAIFRTSFRRFIDSQGRVTLPPFALDRLGQREVVFVGCGSYFSIWDKPTYEAYLKDKGLSPDQAWEELQKNEERKKGLSVYHEHPNP